MIYWYKEPLNKDIIVGDSCVENFNIWGSSSFIKDVYHTEIKVPIGYEHLYTWNRHPSIEGHKKIADWFFNIIDWDNLKNGQ